MPRPKKATDEQIVTAYEALGSVWRVAERFGMCGQTVHARLVELGLNRPQNLFTDADRDRLLRDYDVHVAMPGGLEKLASDMGRTRHFLCRQAHALGLTRQSRPTGRKDRRQFKTPAELTAAKSAIAKRWHAENPHPRGMAGKSHAPETKEVLSVKSRAAHARVSAEERSRRATQAMHTKVELYGSIAPERPGASWKAGWREIGGYRKYYRSRWEANYARYLEWLKQRGEIKDWQHEPETFWFEAIKRGVRSYLPDFRVWENNGATPLHEVKGWMDSRSKTTLKRMAKYHPHETIIVIAERDYNAIARTVCRLITGWEYSEKGRP